MNTATTVADVLQAFGILASISVPIALFVFSRVIASNRERICRIENIVVETRNGLEELKLQVAGNSVKREDFNQFRIEFGQTLTRVREAVSADVSNLNDRLMRLEAPHFRRDGDG